MTAQRPASGLTVVILTLNEEANVADAIDSTRGLAEQVLVIDSFSSDSTVEIARKAGCVVVQNAFVDYARQRNFALEQPFVRTEWIFFLDADERLSEELRRELLRVMASETEENGFYVKWRMIWMGKWIKRGYYPTWVLRMFRHGKGRCEERGVNEHFIVDGKVGYLENDFIHEDRKGIGDWIVKHDRYAAGEAMELLRQDREQLSGEIAVRFTGSQAERKRWLRYRVWNRMPPLLRPFAYFLYRYVVRGGFLDGKPAFIFHFLQGLWFPMLIDIKYLELKRLAHLDAVRGADAQPKRDPSRRT